MATYKLKCGKCGKVKRRVTEELLKNSYTLTCPTCGEKMSATMIGGFTKSSRHPNYFDRGDVPFERR